MSEKEIAKIIDRYTLSVKDVSKLLHVHRNTVGNWVKGGIIPCLVLGNKTRFNIKELLLWIKNGIKDGKKV